MEQRVSPLPVLTKASKRSNLMEHWVSPFPVLTKASKRSNLMEQRVSPLLVLTKAFSRSNLMDQKFFSLSILTRASTKLENSYGTEGLSSSSSEKSPHDLIQWNRGPLLFQSDRSIYKFWSNRKDGFSFTIVTKASIRSNLQNLEHRVLLFLLRHKHLQDLI